MKRRSTTTASWTHVTFVESDNKPGKEYEIDRRDDGALRCACERFRFTRGEIGSAGKTCKHIETLGAVVSLGALRTDGGVTQIKVTPSIKLRSSKSQAQPKEETFTFRRAISFKPLTSASA